MPRVTLRARTARPVRRSAQRADDALGGGHHLAGLHQADGGRELGRQIPVRAGPRDVLAQQRDHSAGGR